MNFILTETLLVIILIVAAIVAHEFYISKNGILRKLMIWNFAIEVFIFICAIAYVAIFEPQYNVFWNLVLVPKAIIKLRILFYLKNKT